MTAIIEFDETQIAAELKKLPQELRQTILEGLNGSTDPWRFFEIIVLDSLPTGPANQQGTVRLGFRLKQI